MRLDFRTHRKVQEAAVTHLRMQVPLLLFRRKDDFWVIETEHSLQKPSH